MKHIILTLIAVLTISVVGFAQQADDILGQWVSSSGEGHIEIYKRGNRYFGKLAWIAKPKDEKGALRLDTKNPDVAARKNSILGLEILKNFSYANQKWEDGTVYDPKSGKTYSCRMTLSDANHLSIRGFIGISLIGKTEVWTRLKK